MKQLEEKYTSEINEFNAEWDNKLKTFQEDSKVQEAGLNEKHAREMQDLIANVEANNSKLIMKFSAQYLQITQAEDKLVKQDKY